jgi:ADP-ribose pyrophosphatase
MALGVWRRLRTSVASKNPWWTYMLDHFELPSGTRGEYHYVHTNGSSMVIPVLPDGQLLLVNQYRYLASRESLEFPCGSVKDGSSHDRTAWEELAEETGYSAGTLLLAGEFNPYNGVTDEMCRVYIARELSFVGGAPEETEEFELVTLRPDELDERIRSGEVWDGMTIAAWGIGRGRFGSKT